MVNEGTADRALRAVAGAALAVLAFAAGLDGAAFWIALALGAVLLVTALTGFCPAYRLLGVNTCGTR